MDTTIDSTVFWRQLDILSHEKITKVVPTLIGIGGLGSPTAMALAKMGIKNLIVYDPDVVDIHNVPNQAYSVNDIGSYKVDALANIVAGYGATVVGNKELYETQSLSGLVIVSVDNMASRKTVWDNVKYSVDVPLLIDMRMGAEVGRIFVISPIKRDHIEYYEANLYSDEEAVELPCTAQAIIYNTFGMASWVGRVVKGFVMGEDLPKEIILDMVSFGVYTVWPSITSGKGVNKKVPIVKVIRVGEPVVDYHVEPGTTVGDFLAAHGIDANGRALVLNGETATASTLISDNATLLLAPAVKGGVR